MVTFKKISATILGFIGLCMLIGAFTSHRGFAYALLCVLIGVLLLVPAIFLWMSAKKTEKSRKTTLENSILKTKIIDAESKKSASSTIARGMVGGAVAGTTGTVIGASLGKSNRQTTFLVLYRDGSKKTVSVQNDSPEYQMYCKFLEI